MKFAGPSMHLLGATLLMTMAAFATGWHLIGNPVAGLDEQFYLLVGDRMLDGALPYVDIWDRKPLGLFLVYAAIRLLPGDGVIAYQVIATLCLAATGLIVAAIARRSATPMAAIAAGLATIGFSTLLGVGMGDAPIFYDPLLAMAAWLILRASDHGRGTQSGTATGVAMLLAGVAITIKTTAVFEGVAFGHRAGRAGIVLGHGTARDPRARSGRSGSASRCAAARGAPAISAGPRRSDDAVSAQPRVPGQPLCFPGPLYHAG